MLPLPPAGAPAIALKAFEDKLDAIICAWVGICTLDGRAQPYGDAESAIWIPVAR
jgi:predicted RNase H-like nuclease